MQHSYIVNNEIEGNGEISAEDEKDIIDPVIKLVLSKTNAPVNETVKANIIVTDNKKVEEIHVLINGEEIEYQGNQVEITSDKVGKTTIEVIAKDNSGNTAKKSAVCNFYDSSDKKVPELDIISPEHDATLNIPTAIIGSVFDETKLAYYTVEYRLKGEEEYTLLVESSEEKHNETLAVFDTTVLANGVYEIKVSAFDNGGNMTYMTGQYVVEGNLKIGNLNLGFEDLNTTVSGVQIAASRYYSSANKQSGDFGTGWSLGISSIHLYEMNEINNYWDMLTSGVGLFSTYSLQETASHDVVITYGDGTSERFKAKLTKDTQRFAPVTNTSIVFESPENSKNKLEILGSNEVYTLGYTNEIRLLDADGELFGIDKYKLTFQLMKTSMKLSKNGCLTIPKDVRVRLGWKTSMSLDISSTPDGALIIRKHAEICRFCSSAQNLCRYKDLVICRSCAETMKGALS